MDFSSPEFWIALLQIVAIDIVLGGDNAVVIGLACRRLPEAQRKKGILYGMGLAIGMRIVLIFFAVTLLAIPYLKIVGALLLFWIGVKLLLPEDEGHHDLDGGTTLASAVKTIIVADVVMSLDNVIAIAGAAGDSMFLIVFGLLLSVPIIMYGSQYVMKLMDRFPIVITLGGALLGWIAGGMLATDVVSADWVAANIPASEYSLPAAGAIIVVILGKIIAARMERSAALKDIAAHDKA